MENNNLSLDTVAEIQKVLKPLGYEVCAFDINKDNRLVIELWHITKD